MLSHFEELTLLSPTLVEIEFDAQEHVLQRLSLDKDLICKQQNIVALVDELRHDVDGLIFELVVECAHVEALKVDLPLVVPELVFNFCKNVARATTRSSTFFLLLICQNREARVNFVGWVSNHVFERFDADLRVFKIDKNETDDCTLRCR